MKIPGKISEVINRIKVQDRALGNELQAKRESRSVEAEAAHLIPETAVEGAPMADRSFVVETIVLRTGRPVLAVSRDEPQLVFRDAESEVWRERLVQARSQLVQAIRAVGRIELENNPRFDWVGTGWLVRPDVVVTNRHVAAEFGRRGGEGFVFRLGPAGRMAASIDFLEEFDREESLSFKLREILHIEDADGPDLAFLRVEGSDLASPIRLFSGAAEPDQFVAVIGYPAHDSRIPDLQLMENIFGDVFDKKRLAPGQITGNGQHLLHDCSTLGGNSGSVVLDLDSGEAVGAHFAGRFLEANFAVPSNLIAQRLDQLGRSETKTRKPSIQRTSVYAQSASTPSGPYSISCTIPLQITVAIGLPQVTQPQTPPLSQSTTVQPAPGEDQEDDEEFVTVEAVPEDYRNRKGYDSKFLGSEFVVKLPKIVRDAGQIVSFQFDGNTERELRYEHFSVIMNRARRLCFFSAVNIDGQQSKKKKRPGWRPDIRIPKELQIQKECYGNPPKFARGHMTRREDPIWGSQASAALGNEDSMHVTNAVPQMQPFNAGIWLGLEDYALDNAREDDMRISVMTGPILRSNDPVHFGVKIPLLFWKVIAFIHDDTGKLCATGYSMSQEDFVREEEFVFGQHKTFQRSLKWIEENAGVSFGDLTALDPFVEVEEALPAPLTDFRQIRFVG